MTNISQNDQAKEPMTVHAFDIWVARLPERKNTHVQHGNRPVVIVSNDHSNSNNPVVTVVPLTSKRKKTAMESHVYLSNRTDGHSHLLCDSIALCEQVQTLDKRQLTKYVGNVSGAFERLAIQHALAVHLNMVA